MPLLLLAVALAAINAGAGCNVIILPPDGSGGSGDGDSGSPIYNNTTDATNKSATYIGADACRSCHVDIGADHRLHGHANALTAIAGVSPSFSASAARAVIPNPPAGIEWTDVSYVFAGYLRAAYFIDLDGVFIDAGGDGGDDVWRLGFKPNGSSPGFSPYPDQAETPDISCLQCHTTGFVPQNGDVPEFQENRPGFPGTWHEAGVQCEACHGPGSNHPPTPEAREMFVDSSASFCGKCHTHGDNPDVIVVRDGFIVNNAQYPELRASGGHSSFNCTFCHDPHVSPNYDNARAIRNACTNCHATQGMALHEGFVFERGDYREPLTCRSCHMPYAGKAASTASGDVVGELGRMGDTRTHIFRINAQATSFSEMFTPDLSAVAKDGNGLAAVSLDFVCLRCHNGIGSAPIIGNMDIVSEIATEMHGKQLSEIAAIRILRTRGWNVSQDGDSAIRLRGGDR
jgi:hypothetical protein